MLLEGGKLHDVYIFIIFYLLYLDDYQSILPRLPPQRTYFVNLNCQMIVFHIKIFSLCEYATSHLR